MMTMKLKCENCGETRNLQKHHIIPRSKGGSLRFLNRITVCVKCHSELHGHGIGGATVIKSTTKELVKTHTESRTYAVRISDPDLYKAIESFKAKNELTDSTLVRGALKILIEQEPELMIPEPVRKWIKKIADGMGRDA